MIRFPSRQLQLLLACLLVLIPLQAYGKEGAQPTLQGLADGDHRLDKSKARNKFRHPVETLKFFGLKPGMTVVEIWPGGGWYTDIIAPYVMKNGKYYAAGRNRDSKNKRIQASIKRYDKKLVKHPELFGKVIVTQLSQNKTEIAPAGSADLVLTFRNIHNWMKFGFDRTIFEAMYKALKPGGVLGIVEHRENPEEFPDPQTLSGYVHEEQVMAMAKAAGFAFIGKSEINANPKDTRKHPKGVWTLPPSLRLKDKDRAKYLAIGESDRMTMMFRKLVY
ncbi:MAG: methyltransferase [Hyphomicrobiaceae bacterium]|nr:methyltransferase [Hyphomicrobiaceae bacterium]